MPDPSTQMRREIEEIPTAVARLLEREAPTVPQIARALRDQDPSFLMSVARGSSDHAATYLKYASELTLGLPMASLGPSVASIYGASLRAQGGASLSVSQSGKSPDIVELTRSLRASGAFSVALTNDASSPLAQVASATLDLQAGPELSVAATKTFVNSLVAGLWLMAEWAEDASLLRALHDLPEVLTRAVTCDWSPVLGTLTGGSLFTLGRGPSFAISNEAALKFKETCQIHAESYSSAEVLHGPVSIVDDGFPAIAFTAADQAEPAVIEVADRLAEMGAQVFTTSEAARRATALPIARSGHWLTDSVALIASFYGLVEQVAVARGINPDTPRNLKKVTETV